MPPGRKPLDPTVKAKRRRATLLRYAAKNSERLRVAARMRMNRAAIRAADENRRARKYLEQANPQPFADAHVNEHNTSEIMPTPVTTATPTSTSTSPAFLIVKRTTIAAAAATPPRACSCPTAVFIARRRAGCASAIHCATASSPHYFPPRPGTR
ncbi:hypothetical protein C8R46DRAFT_1220398 [Mycena filopes]|nr:hypothetical protein C8R46DRAFT_1220398 [Mycena filopes]